MYDALGSDAVSRQVAYKELFRYELEPGFVDEIRSATNGNFALGNDRFTRQVSAALGRRVVPGRPGRPKKEKDGGSMCSVPDNRGLSPVVPQLSMLMNSTEAAELLADLDLGSGVAETDNLLEAARIETSVFDDLIADRVDLIPGTKGSGKTALYRILVDFLPDTLLRHRRVVLAHGVTTRQDTVFLAFKEQFDKLDESDFVDFWCVYLASLANEQFIRNVTFDGYLHDCSTQAASTHNFLSPSLATVA